MASVSRRIRTCLTYRVIPNPASLVTDAATDNRLRLDIWLDVTCLFKTRSEAQRACRGGKVDVNGQRAKPHRYTQPGDRLTITRADGHTQIVLVKALAAKHLAKANARQLYEDVTPAPSPEELELRRAIRAAARQLPRGAGQPDKRQRRALRRLRGR